MIGFEGRVDKNRRKETGETQNRRETSSFMDQNYFVIISSLLSTEKKLLLEDVALEVKQTAGLSSIAFRYYKPKAVLDDTLRHDVFFCPSYTMNLSIEISLSPLLQTVRTHL